MTDQDMVDNARSRIRATINHLVIDGHGKEVFTTRPIWEGSGITENVPPPELGLRAALLSRDIARVMAERFVSEMRAAGFTWQAIAAEYRQQTEPDHDTVSEVFEEVATPAFNTFDSPRMTWRCPSCQKLVSDYGPDSNPHPVDRETNHREDCPRHTEEIEQYERELND